MGPSLLLVLCVLCCHCSAAEDNSIPTVVNLIPNLQHLFKEFDEFPNDSEECAVGELVQIGTVCSPVHPCGNDLCQCCIHTKHGLYVDCSGKNLSSIPPLPSGVKVLKFSANALSSDDINQTFFDNVRDLTHLYLSDNRLTYIHRSMFEKLTKLKCLNVNRNFLLQKTPASLLEMLAIPGLRQLTVSDSFVFIENLKLPANSSVEYLFLSNILLGETFRYNMTELSTLVELKQLYASGNQFKLVFTLLPLQVRSLVFQTNGLTSFPKTCADDGGSLFPKLQELTLRHNLILDPYEFTKDFCLPELTLLDLNYNRIFILQFNFFSGEHFPKLKILYITKQSNVISKQFTIKGKAFSNPSLKKLSLQDNNILFGNRDLVASDAFENCTNLTELYLDRSSLRYVDDERFQELFGGLRSLTILSLADCQLEAVSENSFKTFQKLVSLFLGGNWISSIPDNTFKPLRNLEFLDLSNNKLAYVSQHALSPIIQNNVFYIGLSSNPFSCSCALIWLRDMYRANPVRFKLTTRAYFFNIRYNIDHSVDLTCENLHGLSLANFSLAHQACLLSEQTSVLITYTCSLLVVALTAFLLLFAYRWHFRLLLYEAFRGTGQARRLRLQQNNFNYDVFVSYASHDLPWVRRHLMPQLEDRLGQRLCIHERDFAIGNNIVDNIAECVESSKKILMVFSKSFVLSQWCQFELNYCLNHVMGHDDSLIIVCVDDVVSHEMTSAMMAVLKTTTYIQWAEEEYYATESFWGRIKIALQEILNIGEHVV